MSQPQDSAVPVPVTGPPVKRRWPRWLYRGSMLVLALTLLLWCAHPWLLRRLAAPLIHSEPERAVELLIVLDGRQGYEAAAEWLKTGRAKRLVLYHRAPSRVVALGVLPTHYELSRQVVDQLQIPENQIEILPGEIAELEGLLLRAVEMQQSGQSVGLVISEWRSQLVHEKIALLSPTFGGRPALILVKDPEVQVANWWKTRHGIRHVAMCWTRLLASRCTDDSDARPGLDRSDFRRAAVSP